MGYYLPNNKPLSEQGATEVPKPSSFNEIPSDKALICEVDNGPLKANGLIFDKREFEDFSYPDGRPKRWFYMDKRQAHKLANYNEN